MQAGPGGCCRPGSVPPEAWPATGGECQTGPVKSLGTGQRVILVTGLGVALLAAGEFFTGPLLPTGWTGYAPLPSRVLTYPGGLAWPWVTLVLRLVLTAVWVAVSMFIFRQPAKAPAATEQAGKTPGAP